MSNIFECPVEVDTVTDEGIESIDLVQRVLDFFILRRKIVSHSLFSRSYELFIM